MRISGVRPINVLPAGNTLELFAASMTAGCRPVLYACFTRSTVQAPAEHAADGAGTDNTESKIVVAVGRIVAVAVGNRAVVVVVVVAATAIDAIGARRSVRLRTAPFCGVYNAARAAQFATLRWLFSQRVFLLYRTGTDNTKSKIVAAAGRIVAAAAGNRAVVVVVAVAAAATDALGARRSPAPFPHVAAHIVDAERVRLLGSYIMCRVTAVVAIPCHLINTVASGILVALYIFSACRRIFPFLACRQAVAIRRKVTGDIVSATAVAWHKPFLFAPLVAVVHGIIPAYTFHRMI